MMGAVPNRIHGRGKLIHVTAESGWLTISGALIVTLLIIVILFFVVSRAGQSRISPSTRTSARWKVCHT